MKTVSVWKEAEIYKEALEKICSMMYAHDPPSPDYMPDAHQLEECCRLAGEALDYVRDRRKKSILIGCIHEGLETCKHPVESVATFCLWKCEKYQKGDE